MLSIKLTVFLVVGQAPTHLLLQNRKTRAMWFDLIMIEPGFGTLYHHVILNLIFSYFATAAGKNQCGGLCLFDCGAAVLVIPDIPKGFPFAEWVKNNIFPCITHLFLSLL